jgi:hypothetical protein
MFEDFTSAQSNKKKKKNIKKTSSPAYTMLTLILLGEDDAHVSSAGESWIQVCEGDVPPRRINKLANRILNIVVIVAVSRSSTLFCK